jgi:hypothetical protein
MWLSAYREDTVQIGPVQQREPHGADAELVQWKGKVGVGPGQQLDAVPSEQRHVTFPRPQHGVDPEPRPVIGVAVVRIAAVRISGARGKAGGEAGVDEERVACLDGEVCGVLGVFEFGAGDHMIGREPRETVAGGDVEQHAPGEDAVFQRGDGVGGQPWLVKFSVRRRPL